eukprot:augustus_masked-scaffold_34-processed-gene-2.30-mRNA-1 protein AED:0.31 eAED:0.33 QI:0/-1/0/1/-1/1/1/0/606
MKPLSEPNSIEPKSIAGKLVSLLVQVERDVDTFPPKDDAAVGRYGDTSFRPWLENSSIKFNELLALNGDHLNIQESSTYFSNCFGEQMRLDYGTGHEANFLFCLFVLVRGGLLSLPELQSSFCKVFRQYLSVCRTVQRVYRLEPAGSHGVWSLDDYQLLCFYFGAAELSNTKASPSPRNILSRTDVETFASEFMFFEAVNHILKLKTGDLAIHSPILTSLAKFSSWSDLRDGLLYMFKGEVLGKFPVAQHIYFGKVLFADWPEESEQVTKPKSPFDLAEENKSVVEGYPGATDVVSRYFKKQKRRGARQRRNVTNNISLFPVKQTLPLDIKLINPDSLTGISGIEIGSWKILARRDAKIGSEAEMQTLKESGEYLDFPFPEETFIGNFLSVENSSGLCLQFDAKGALKGVHLRNTHYKNHERSQVKLKNAENWRQRRDQNGNTFTELEAIYDWTYTTSFSVEVANSNKDFVNSVDKVDLELLKQYEPILFYAEVPIYEDDLGDFGIAKYSVKIRVMKSCYFVLARFFLRVDGEFLRVYDTRLFHKFGSDKVISEQVRKECSYQSIFSDIGGIGKKFTSPDLRNEQKLEEIISAMPVILHTNRSLQL